MNYVTETNVFQFVGGFSAMVLHGSVCIDTQSAVNSNPILIRWQKNKNEEWNEMKRLSKKKVSPLYPIVCVIWSVFLLFFGFKLRLGKLNQIFEITSTNPHLWFKPNSFKWYDVITAMVSTPRKIQVHDIDY